LPPILGLPKELLVDILSLLPFRDLLRVEASCQYLRNLVTGHQLYRASYLRICHQQGIKAFLEEDVDQETEPLDSSLLSRCYKQKLFSLLKPGHYHCKGSYNYYIQVLATLKFCLECNCKIQPSISFIQVSANLKLIA